MSAEDGDDGRMLTDGPLSETLTKQVIKTITNGLSAKRKREGSDSSVPEDDEITLVDQTMLEEVKSELTAALERIQQRLKGFDGSLGGQKRQVDKNSQEIDLQKKRIDNIVVDLDDFRTKTYQKLEDLKTDNITQKTDLKNAKEDVKRLSNEVKSQKDSKLDAYRKIIDLEARSRRSNLLFFGIQESKDENVEEKVRNFIKDELKLVKNVSINRCHRLGAPKKNVIGKNAFKPRPIIVNFCFYKEKEEVRERRTVLSTEYGMANDLPDAVRRAQKTLIPQLKELKKTVKRSAIVYPCKLISDGEVKASRDVALYFEVDE